MATSYDEELELYNYHARFYDPTIARFLQIDPAHEFYNPYSYVGGIPNLATDPSGMVSWQAVGAAIAGAFIAAVSITASVLTLGLASPIAGAAIGSTIGFWTSVGAGIGGGLTAAIHAGTNIDSDVLFGGGAEGFYSDVAISGAFGALGGAAGAGISSAGWSTAVTIAADTGVNVGLAAVDSYASHVALTGETHGANVNKSVWMGAAIAAGTAATPIAFRGITRHYRKILTSARAIRSISKSMSYSRNISLTPKSGLKNSNYINIDGQTYSAATSNLIKGKPLTVKLVPENPVGISHRGISSSPVNDISIEVKRIPKDNLRKIETIKDLQIKGFYKNAAEAELELYKKAYYLHGLLVDSNVRTAAGLRRWSRSIAKAQRLKYDQLPEYIEGEV